MGHDIRIGEALNDIGNELAFILDRQPDGSFLYSEAAENTCSAAVFVESNDEVRFVDPTDELFDLIQHLWDLAEPDKKWTVLEYAVAEGKMKASFTYPEDIDPDESEMDRSERALRKRYGEKPIIYPNDDDDNDFVELTLDDLAHLDDEEAGPAPRQ